VQMDGPGTWTLSGANSYTSTTTVNGGRLVISGANSGAGTSTAVNAGTLTLSNATALGAAANVQFPATSTGTLDLALSAGSDVPYTIGTNTTSNITVQSDVATPGPGVTHSTGAWTLGGGSIAIQAGPNVTGGAPALSIPSVNLTAGSTQTTTFIPTTASVTIGTVSNGSAQAHTLALDGTASGNVITGAISASQGTLNVTKSNTSTWTLSGNNTYNGTTSVSGGTLTIDAAGSMSGTSYTVAAGATLNVNGLIPTNSTITTSGTAAFGGNGGATTSTRSVGTLTVNAGGLAKISASAFPFTPVILRLGTLSFTNSSAKLDLANNATIATGTAGGALSLIANGQIFSSQAADANFAIGYTDLSGADAGKYEARYTLKGDANLDGAVDVGDLGALATSYGVTGGRSWVNGDFNRDGNVDVADLGALATNYGTQLAAGPAFDGSTVAVPTALAAGGVAVPEPASLGVLVFGAIGLTRRHRRGSEKERG